MRLSEWRENQRIIRVKHLLGVKCSNLIEAYGRVQ